MGVNKMYGLETFAVFILMPALMIPCDGYDLDIGVGYTDAFKMQLEAKDTRSDEYDDYRSVIGTVDQVCTFSKKNPNWTISFRHTSSLIFKDHGFGSNQLVLKRRFNIK